VSVAFRQLLPVAGEGAAAPTLTAADAVAALDLRGRAPAGRPYVGLNMIATLDGRATISGRTAPIAGQADFELFHALRAGADAVLVGAHTVRVEGYGAMDQLAVVVSGSLDLPVDRGLLAYPGNRVVVVTTHPGELPPAAAEVAYLRTGDLGEALAALAADHGVRAAICEGGPHLNATLLPAGLVDELFLALAPKLAGGPDPLTILSGAPLDPPLTAELRSLLEADGFLFARYGLAAAGAS
jgi:riboflavin biosynthesis pyrimidine reductase